MDKLDVCFLGNWYLGSEILKDLINKVNIKTIISTSKEDHFSQLVQTVAESENIEFYNTSTSNWKEVLKNNNYDLLISVSFGFILSADLYKKCKYGAINLHQSILPQYRGKDPITNAIINNENKIGFTIHYIDDGIDTGNILFQAAWPLSLNDTLETINFKTSIFAKNIFHEVINEIIIKDQSLGFIQDGNFSLAPKINSIPWNQTVLKIRKEHESK